jgi:hypothetical protein
VFFGSMFWPIPNESLDLVSPLHHQAYQDFQFYIDSLEQYRTLSLMELWDLFSAFYQRPLTEQFGYIIAGPVFPGLVGVFKYGEGSTVPMGLFYLGVSCLLAFIWLKYLSSGGVHFFWLLVLAIAPNPIWFTLIISPDIIFAIFVTIFHFFYFKDQKNIRDNITWITFLLLLLLTRPNGYSILLFVLFDFCLRSSRGERIFISGTVILVILSVLFALYLYPYFVTATRITVTDIGFFNQSTAEYHQGLFPNLPEFIDITLSWILLAGAKLLYFTGLRPSYGDTSMWLVALRGAAGLVLLPGLLYVFIKAERREQLFISIFFLPIFIGPTQDRYNLPVFAILFMYGTMFWNSLLINILRLFSPSKSQTN